jgi:hypothetical protein
MMLRLLKLAITNLRRIPSERSFPRGLALTFITWTIAIMIISTLGPNVEVRSVSMNYWLLAGFICITALPNKQIEKEQGV